ncbi:DHH family phosphoesterase [Salimicrobium halophilum]|uniref:Phosphoesterase RecJ domain-containing protein n=1 Tax=Salimicrobium halophilum TaxID=86666 RepID=A0A1G8VI05_9BACI|nr:bifunctional oligoribonuclease/PAP phosphatase NrnA [Salimicrobium halophilum]SDJ65731.1 phosphoesterase RecJ domain-containing protein [Salimicrobium halophilum]
MYEQIKKEIEDHPTIIIHRHVRPDPDALGSQIGLKMILEASYPDKKVLVTGENDESFEFLGHMDEIRDEDYEGALVIVNDTANQERIDDERYSHGESLIKIDHHPVVDEYGDVQWVETDSSSTSEMIFVLTREIEGWIIPEEAARLLYAGIVGDTGRFLFPSTTERTFEAASELIRHDFDRPALYDHLYKTPIHLARLKGYILQNVTVSDKGHAAIPLTKETLDEFGVHPLETSKLVGILGDMEGILSWVFFVEEDSEIRVRLRSKGPVVNKLAERHRGGGHPMAAGARAEDWEETKKIDAELYSICEAYQKENG